MWYIIFVIIIFYIVVRLNLSLFNIIRNIVNFITYKLKFISQDPSKFEKEVINKHEHTQDKSE